MASIQIKTNLGEVIGDVSGRLAVLENPDYLLRPVCFDLIDLMTKRIHENGIASDGSPIGTYNNAYLKLREKKYSRTADKKVIVSLTRQLENDWSVIPTTNGYGIGFKNSLNFDKAGWVEEQKDKVIFSLSTAEEAYAFQRFTDLTAQALAGNGTGNN